MTSLSRTRALRRLLLPILLVPAWPALAQYPAGAVVQRLPRADDPAELLAQALRTLATEPGNLPALTAAGRNALALGDPNAAVGFFGRASEIAPRDGRVKAGLGSALVQLEKPQDALRLFAEASRLGVPDADLAEDRGLAYDLTGDPRRAQKDYLAVLAANPGDDAVRRGLALSQGISGDRAAAIATLDPLIRKRDIAGWRAQTFVLAMTGDAKGAGDITHIMLPQQADMLQPFLQRLATLSPADKARAVHFGEMPQGGAAYSPTRLAMAVTPPAAAMPVPARAVAPRRSDLAPVTATSESPRAGAAATPMPVAAQQPTRLAAVTPDASGPTPATAAQPIREVAPRYYGPRETGAPLAGIALTPNQPVVATPASPPTVVAAIPRATAPAPQPTTTVVQTFPAKTEFLDAPVPPPPGAGPGLPMPAATGHYDLPHAAAPRSAPRPAPVRVATPKPAPAKTIGTPVVHGRTGSEAAVDESASAGSPKMRSSGKTKPAEQASAEPDEASDVAPAPSSRKGRGTKLAAADTNDDGTGKSSKARGRAKADTQDETAGSRSKGAKGKSSAADDASATDDKASTGKGKGKGAKGKAAKFAAATDSDDTGSAKAGRARGRDKEDVADSGSPSSRSTKAAKTKKGKAETAPERVYVQVAGGANRDDMDKAWTGVKKKAPDLMKGKAPSTTPLRATNRLLVGPFKDEDEAQAFVNKMAGKGLSGFTFKSGKGQKVEKIDGAR